MIRFALAGVLLLGAVCAAAAQEIPLDRAASGHVTIGVRFSGGPPVPFVLDTGANRTAVVAAYARARGLPLERGEAVRMHGLTGASHAVLFDLEDTDIGAGAPMSLRAVTIPEPPDAARRLPGLLGLDAFAGRRVEIDLTANRIRLDAPPPPADQARPLSPAGLPVIEAEIGGVRALALIDTGLTHSVANPALIEALAPPALRRRVQVIGLASGAATAQDQVVDDVRIGTLRRPRMLLAAADLAVFETLGLSGAPALIAGLDVLNGAIITIDLAQGVFWLAAPAQ
ncbi:MAG: aspartyl protease family protein [Maricaulaceae bacterium]|nr:aspartyl protease family protein [Maricaulaceae bacterium]